LYRAYKFSKVTQRFSRQIDKISETVKVSKHSPGRRSPGGGSFHSQGPEAKKVHYGFTARAASVCHWNWHGHPASSITWYWSKSGDGVQLGTGSGRLGSTLAVCPRLRPSCIGITEL